MLPRATGKRFRKDPGCLLVSSSSLVFAPQGSHAPTNSHAGNLSQERVSKRDVFEHFYRYGRLAQVSIKSAFGFVQFHSAEEAAAAMRDLEGTEIRGRKIRK